MKSVVQFGYARNSLVTAVAVTIALATVGFFFHGMPVVSGISGASIFGTESISGVGANGNKVLRLSSANLPSVYFNNPIRSSSQGVSTCGDVYPVPREVPGKDMASQEVGLLLSLIKGPSKEEGEDGYTSPFSEITELALISISVQGGTAAVNLADIRSLSSSDQDGYCVALSIMNSMDSTLRQFDGIDKVIYAIVGSPEKFYDWVGLSCEAENPGCDDSMFR